MLVDLEEDSVQYEAGGLGHVQGLLSLSQPVDGVLQRGLETCCQGNGLFQLGLEAVQSLKLMNKTSWENPEGKAGERRSPYPAVVHLGVEAGPLVLQHGQVLLGLGGPGACVFSSTS